MNHQQILRWLLRGDVSIQYQTNRDLLSVHRDDLRARIASQGWGKRFLSKRKPGGHWGKKFYEPKWTSTHYTLLDLRNLCITPDHPLIKESIRIILEEEKGTDGGVKPIGREQKCDVCVNGMVLNYASYFQAKQEDLKSIVDFILSQRMTDGGFNCNYNTIGATHSSLHSTLSVLEGIIEYEKNGFRYRASDLSQAKNTSIEFILRHQLFRSHRTGKIINRDFLKLTYPGRWRYDILRALDCLRYAGIMFDRRMEPAIEILLEKRNKDSTWNMQARHVGQIHFEMEKTGRPSRWNTLRAMRVLKHLERMPAEGDRNRYHLNERE